MMRLLILDGKQLLRDRVGIVVLLTGVFASSLAGWTGHVRLRHAQQAHQAAITSAETQRKVTRRQIANASETEASSIGGTVTQASVLPVPTLLDFSIGRSAFEPASFTLRMRSRSDTVFRNYQSGNPELTARAPIDLALVISVLCPILLIAVGYGVISSDRDSGTAPLLLAQAASYGRIVRVRTANRFLLVAIPPLAAAAVMLGTQPLGSTRLTAGSLWADGALLSLAVWWALILLVNTFCRTAETALFRLGALYVVVTFGVPAVAGPLSQWISSPPSRLAQVAEQRRAQTSITDSFENDHSNLTADTIQQNHLTMYRNYLLAEQLEQKMQPIVSRTDDAIQRQQSIQKNIGLLSPAITTEDLLARIAGTDGQHYLALRQAARSHTLQFRDSILPSVAERRAYTVADFDSAPAFIPPDVTAQVALPLLWLAFLLVGILAVSARRISDLTI